MRMEQIGSKLRVIAGAISLDLLDNELGVSFHKELPDPQRQGCTQPKEQGLVLSFLVCQISKWFYDTCTGAATGAVRCGSFSGKAFSLLVVSSR
jgi:hypothetical protein